MRYTTEEITFLKNNYPSLGPSKCGEILNRSIAGVAYKAYSLGLYINRRYTEKEIHFIKKNYPKMGSLCGKCLGRSKADIREKAHSLGLKFEKRYYTDEEKQFLINNYCNKTAKECADYLGRSIGSVRYMITKLCINTKEATAWSKEDEQFLFDNYNKLGPIKCSRYINKKPDAIKGRARKLGLTLNRDVFNNLQKTKAREKLDYILNNRNEKRLSEYINAHTKVEILCPNKHRYMGIPSNIVSLDRGCPYCYKTIKEEMIRTIFEYTFDTRFAKERPEWLIDPETTNAMELDGYSSSLRLAFEYQGRQHKQVMWYDNGDNSRLLNLKERDALKKEICDKYHVHLIVIPSLHKVVAHQKIIDTVVRALKAENILINKQIDYRFLIGKLKNIRHTRNYYTYKEASIFARRLGIHTKQDYYRQRYKDPRLPENPYTYYYNKGWISWLHFLNKTRYNLYDTYKEAQCAANILQICSLTDYRKQHKKDPKLPSTPDVAYKNKGWVSWFRFVGDVPEPRIKINLLTTNNN